MSGELNGLSTIDRFDYLTVSHAAIAITNSRGREIADMMVKVLI